MFIPGGWRQLPPVEVGRCFDLVVHSAGSHHARMSGTEPLRSRRVRGFDDTVQDPRPSTDAPSDAAPPKTQHKETPSWKWVGSIHGLG